MTTIVHPSQQAKGAFNGGQIIENKPIGFNREGGKLRPYSNLFYWAHAVAQEDSTIGLHPHQGFEIMSFVLKGQIKHYDTVLDEWRPLEAGDAQVIRAGKGISHSEWMGQGSSMFQIWLDPNLAKTMAQPASYDDYTLASVPVEEVEGNQVRRYAGTRGVMHLDTPGVAIERWNIHKHWHLPLQSHKIHSLYIASGSFTLDDEILATNDFVKVEGSAVHLEGSGEVFLISSPAKVDYDTYGQLMQRRLGRQSR